MLCRAARMGLYVSGLALQRSAASQRVSTPWRSFSSAAHSLSLGSEREISMILRPDQGSVQIAEHVKSS